MLRIVAACAAVTLICTGLAACGGGGESSTTTLPTLSRGELRAARQESFAAAERTRRQVLQHHPRLTSSGRALDAYPPAALATDGRRVVWVRDLGRGFQNLEIATGRRLATRTVLTALPFRVSQVAVGTDSRDRPVAVLERDGAASPVLGSSRGAPSSDEALYAVDLDGPPRLRRLPLSNASGTEGAPSIHRGRVAFARRVTVDGHPQHQVRVGSMTVPTSRELWHSNGAVQVVSTAITADDTVAFTERTTSHDDALTSWTLRVASADTDVRELAALGSGQLSTVGYGSLTATHRGRRITASQWVGGDARSGSALRTFRLTGPHKPRTVKTPDVDIAVPLQNGGAVGFHTDAVYEGCLDAQDAPDQSVYCPLVIKRRTAPPQQPPPSRAH